MTVSVVEEVVSNFRGWRVVVRLPIHISADVGDGWGRGFFGEFHGSGCFSGGVFVDCRSEFFGQNALIDQAAAENGDGIMVLFVVLDFLRSPVFLVI